MMIGLGRMGYPNPGDMCVDLSSGTAVPCSTQPADNLLCADPATGQHDRCKLMIERDPFFSFALTGPLPILSLADVLQRCNTPNCSIAGAVPPYRGGCDPLIRAAGYDCQTNGVTEGYTPSQIVGGKLYTSDGEGVINTPSANQYGLNPTQVNYLMQAGIIQPVTSMNQPLLVNPNAQAPTYGPGASTAVQAAFTQQGQSAANALPYAPNALPNVPMVPRSSTADTLALGTGQGITAGTIPGANTAGGASQFTAAADTSGDILPGLPNKTLYIAAAALLALVVLK